MNAVHLEFYECCLERYFLVGILFNIEVYTWSGCPISLNAYRWFLWLEHLAERSRMEDLDIDGRIMLT